MFDCIIHECSNKFKSFYKIRAHPWKNMSTISIPNMNIPFKSTVCVRSRSNLERYAIKDVNPKIRRWQQCPINGHLDFSCEWHHIVLHHTRSCSTISQGNMVHPKSLIEEWEHCFIHSWKVWSRNWQCEKWNIHKLSLLHYYFLSIVDSITTRNEIRNCTFHWITLLNRGHLARLINLMKGVSTIWLGICIIGF